MHRNVGCFGSGGVILFLERNPIQPSQVTQALCFEPSHSVFNVPEISAEENKSKTCPRV